MFVVSPDRELQPPPALLIASIVGATYDPSGALMSRYPRSARDGVVLRGVADRPVGLLHAGGDTGAAVGPGPDRPVDRLVRAHLGAHSGLSSESHPVNTAVVPDSSERCTIVMAVEGGSRPGSAL